MTTVVDTYDRADSTTPIGTASDGGTWTIFAGFFGISSNKAYISSLQAISGIGPSSSVHSAIRDLSSATVDLSCDVFRSGTSGIGVLWFALDSATQHHGYYLQYKSDTSIILQRWNASTGGATLATWTVSAWTSSTKTLRVTYDSSTGVITGYLNGTQIGTYTDATPETGTTVGFGSTVDTTTSGDTWDNFSATSVLTTPPLALAGTSAGAATATGSLGVSRPLAGSAAGVATAAGSLTIAGFQGTSAGASTSSASLSVANLAGTAAGHAVATATLQSLVMSGAIGVAGSSGVSVDGTLVRVGIPTRLLRAREAARDELDPTGLTGAGV